jgi:hypothetical protein
MSWDGSDTRRELEEGVKHKAQHCPGLLYFLGDDMTNDDRRCKLMRRGGLETCMYLGRPLAHSFGHLKAEEDEDGVGGRLAGEIDVSAMYVRGGEYRLGDDITGPLALINLVGRTTGGRQRARARSRC